MSKQMTPKKPQDEFMDYVQMHERLWGTKTYAGRPTLGDILDASIIIFWKEENRKPPYTITLHEELRDIEILLFKMLFRQGVNQPRKRPVRVFQGRKRIVVKNVRLEFQEID